MRRTNKPIILHAMERFGSRTQTFIYNYLTAAERTLPFVLAGKRISTNEFPFERVKIINDELERRVFLLRCLGKGFRLLTGKGTKEWRVDRFSQRLRPNLIHAHFGPTGFAMLGLKEKLNVPLVTTFYGFDMSKMPRHEKWKENYAKLFEIGDLFLVEGPHMRQKLIEIGAPEEKTEIQRIAIHLVRYPEWRPKNGIPTVLFVGRWVEKKGLHYALEAVRRLREEVPTLSLRVIGDGPERAKVLRFVKDNQMEGSVVFLGMMPHVETIKEMQECHVLIQPSLTAADGDSEGGAPTTILEAQAVGIPVVATNHADIPNVTVKGNGVYLCEEKDVEGLVENLRTALKRKGPCDKSFISRFHNVRTEIKLLEDKYLRLIGEKSDENP